MECQNIEINEEVAKATLYEEYLDLKVMCKEINFFQNTPNKFPFSSNLKFNFEEGKPTIRKLPIAKAEDPFFTDFIFPSYFNFFFNLDDFLKALEFINACHEAGKSVTGLLRALVRSNYSFITAFESSLIDINNQKILLETKIEKAISNAFSVFPNEVIELVKFYEKENTEKFFKTALVEPTISLLKNQSPDLKIVLSNIKTDRIRIQINEHRCLIPFKKSVTDFANVISSNFDSNNSLPKIDKNSEFIPTIFFPKFQKEAVCDTYDYQLAKEVMRQKEVAKKVRFYYMKELLQNKVWNDPSTAFNNFIDSLDKYQMNHTPEFSNHVKDYRNDIAKAEYINFLNCFIPTKGEVMKAKADIYFKVYNELFEPTLMLLETLKSVNSKFGDVFEASYAISKDLMNAMNFNIKIPSKFLEYFKNSLIQKRLHAVLIYSILINLKNQKYSSIVGGYDQYCKFMQTFFDISVYDEKVNLIPHVNSVLFKVN